MLFHFLNQMERKSIFQKSDLDNWIMRNPVKSAEQIEEEAQKFITRKS